MNFSPTNFSIPSQYNEPMMLASDCLALHGELLQQMLYLKITIAVLIICILLFLGAEYKRKIKK